jgi:hypothetical protein
MIKLLDVTDRAVRRLQLTAMAGSGLLMGVAASMVFVGLGSLWVPAIALGGGMVGMFIAGGIRQRWEVEYKGHQIRFENSPLTGERLYLDGGLVSRGGVGTRMELRAPIRVGEGAGEEIMALADAALLHIRLRLYVESDLAEAPVSTPGTVSSQPSVPAGPKTATATGAHAIESVRHTGALGRLVLARRAIEFVGSLITVITTAAAALLWLLRSTGG